MSYVSHKKPRNVENLFKYRNNTQTLQLYRVFRKMYDQEQLRNTEDSKIRGAAFHCYI
jgi:hypothetical protein